MLDRDQTKAALWERLQEIADVDPERATDLVSSYAGLFFEAVAIETLQRVAIELGVDLDPPTVDVSRGTSEALAPLAEGGPADPRPDVEPEPEAPLPPAEPEPPDLVASILGRLDRIDSGLALLGEANVKLQEGLGALATRVLRAERHAVKGAAADLAKEQGAKVSARKGGLTFD